MKTRNQFLSLVLVLLSVALAKASDYPTTVLSFNPVGYWRLSESVSPPAANIIINYGTFGAAGNAYPQPYGNVDPANSMIMGAPGLISTSIIFTNPAPTSANGNWSSC